MIDHFAFKVKSIDEKVEDRIKIKNLHCNKQFTYNGSKFYLRKQNSNGWSSDDTFNSLHTYVTNSWDEV